MLYGICNLSIIALRKLPEHSAEMTNQMLFGEFFEILESNKQWSKIKLNFDNFEGYVNNNQYTTILPELYEKLLIDKPVYSAEIIDFVTNNNNELKTIPLGARLPFFKNSSLKIGKYIYSYKGITFSNKKLKYNIVKVAYNYLNTPFLWGGKTPFGIDSSGFSQMVYKLCGYTLFRDVKKQARQGQVLSFIEESEIGDLAFFDNEEGEIIHVGIILNNYQIIHAHGKVRIDSLDHTGIFNVDLQKHTHRLRVIKKLI